MIATTTETRERPILFSGAMVRAILEGRKTQTRRVVVPQYSTPRVPPITMEPWLIDGIQETDDHGLPCWAGFHPDYPGEAKWFSCPYGKAGDRLWVRETWFKNAAGEILYRADYGPESYEGGAKGWKPSIHMRREYSRISLEVVSVKVERVRDISEEDAVAEGMAEWAKGACSRLPEDELYARAYFELAWNSINGKRYPWDSNPWVWVITFKRITTTAP